MTSGKQPHILNASSNLLGICFIVITGLKLSGSSDMTWADEVSALSAFCLLSSCVLSYVSLRTEKHPLRYEVCADYSFLGGVLLLFIAVLAFARDFFLASGNLKGASHDGSGIYRLILLKNWVRL